MSYRYKYFGVTGVANSTVEDGGIASTPEESRHLESVILYTNDIQGNRIQLYLDRECILDVPDYVVITDDSSGSTNVQRATNRMIEFPIEIPIPVGILAKIAIRSGATGTNIFGAYKYKID